MPGVVLELGGIWETPFRNCGFLNSSENQSDVELHQIENSKDSVFAWLMNLIDVNYCNNAQYENLF